MTNAIERSSERRAEHTRKVIWERRLDWIVTVAAALVIPAVYLESETHGRWHAAGAGLDWVIWLAFLGELCFYLFLRPRPLNWVRAHPLEVAVVLLTPPFAPAAVQTIRFFRILRLMRLLRFARSARTLLSLEGVKYIGVLTALVVVGGGEAFANAEGTSSWNGLWWAITTATTVGYGDVPVTTTLGRLIAIALMLVGIAFVAVITAAIAERFLASDVTRVGRELQQVESQEYDVLTELREIRDRVERVEQALSRASGHAS